jgi:hypothetical protein
MISLTVETKRYRVQVSENTVWVESRSDARWTFRAQHSVPIPPKVLATSREACLVRAALRHYEACNKGDQSLRYALTGIRAAAKSPSDALPGGPPESQKEMGRAGLLPGRVDNDAVSASPPKTKPARSPKPASAAKGPSGISRASAPNPASDSASTEIGWSNIARKD